MKFKATPNLLVRVNKNIPSNRRLRSFRFDSNGIYETENPRLIKALQRRFAVVNEEVIEVNLKHCKQCDYTSDNQGQLLQHYREKHPKKV